MSSTGTFYMHVILLRSVEKNSGARTALLPPFLIQTNLLARVHFASIMKCCDLETSGHNSCRNNGMVGEHNFRIIDSGALHVLVIAVRFSFPSVARLW